MRECEHEHVPGQGIFMEELIEELERRGIIFDCEEIGLESGTQFL